MSRPLRIVFPGAYYHVMNRGLARQDTFLHPPDHDRFLLLLDDLSERWAVRIYAYCCLTTHYHLLLQTPHPNLPRVMRHLDGLYTQRFNRAHHRDGPLFRGRYKALLVQAEPYLLHVVRYIHLNPVDAGLTHDPGAYPWSSHRLYSAAAPPAWLARDEILASFTDAAAFERFVAEGNERSLELFYARPRSSPVLGDPRFTAWALALAHRSREHPRAQRTAQFASIDQLVAAVCQRTGTSAETVSTSRRGSPNLSRNLAIYLASRVAGFSHAEIKRCLALGTDSAVTRACDRTEQLLARRPHLQSLIRSLAP